MEDFTDDGRVNLPAVVGPRGVMRATRAQQRPTRWHSGLPDRLRQASRHPAVAGSLATAAGLMLHAGLRWILMQPGQAPGPAVTAAPAALINGESVVLVTRTVVVQTWTVRGRFLGGQECG
ncbi:MAG: hypothetical protein WCC38_15115 [Pseudonocardiaceae bacterium]